MMKKILGAICLLVLCGILAAGLWPFHSPRNEVGWLNDGSGLLFGKYGSVVSAAPFTATQAQANSACSIEISLAPSDAGAAGTILAFYRPESRVVPFSLRQSRGDLVLERAPEERSQGRKNTKVYVGRLFARPKPIFIAISSSESGTTVYADGAFVKKLPIVFSRADLTGKLVIGNAPATTHNWSGKLWGLAISGRELSASEVSEHYSRFKNNDHPILTPSNGLVALYPFTEHNGNVVHNQVDAATDLVIPERFFVLNEQFLETPWSEYHPGLGYWKNVAINIAGFIPLGFFFCAYFSSVRKTNRAVTGTIALGLAVSLTIEVLQAFLPTRDSGMTDLITNTLGTAIGAISYARIAKSEIRSEQPARGLLVAMRQGDSDVPVRR